MTYKRKRHRSSLDSFLLFIYYGFKRFILGLFRKGSYKTLGGEIVKSKIERRIANWFHRRKINYVYEKKVAISKDRYLRPDFYFPDSGKYLEYYGLKTHPTKGKKYLEDMVHKQGHYRRLGLTVIEFDHNHADDIEKHLQDVFRI